MLDDPFLIPVNPKASLHTSALTAALLSCARATFTRAGLLRSQSLPGFTRKAFHSSARPPSPLPPLLVPSHDAVSFPVLRIGCTAAAVLREGSSLCTMRVAGTGIRPAHRCLAPRRLTSPSVAFAPCCLGHVAPGLDPLHQRSCGKSCRWTCVQVS